MRISKSDRVIICPKPLRSNPLVVAVVYFGGIVGISLAFATVARTVDPLLCPLVLFATLVAIGVIGTLQLASVGALNKPYVDLMRIFYKGLPGILGKQAPEGKDVSPIGLPGSAGISTPA